MGLFDRMFKVAQSEAHSVVDKLEDPIKLTEQGIRDLRKDLASALQGLAQVKALAIQRRREIEKAKQEAGSYERKAMLLLQKAQAGELDAGQADRLAGEALARKEQAAGEGVRIATELAQHENMVAKMESNVTKLKSQINTWENELRTLKARAKVAAATKKVNKQLAAVDSSSTIAMLEKMKGRVDEDEALAASYGELAQNVDTSVDEEINQALGSGGSTSQPGADSLAALKAKMGIS